MRESLLNHTPMVDRGQLWVCEARRICGQVRTPFQPRRASLRHPSPPGALPALVYRWHVAAVGTKLPRSRHNIGHKLQ